MSKFLKVFIWIGVIALVIFLTLFIAAAIGKFDSIGSMLDFIMRELKNGPDYSASVLK